MYKKKIDVNKLKLGDRLVADIYTKEGVLAVAKDTPLTPLLINKIKILENRLVVIDLEKIYEDSLEQCKKIINKAAEEERVEVREVEKAIEPFVHEVSREKNILRLLLELQNQDDYTFQHTIHVGIMAMVIGRILNLSRNELHSLALAGTLHDIGKVKIPSGIINKPGKLTKEEFDHIKKHTIYGYEILQKSGISDEIQKVALMHHEKCDGTGYPLKLNKEEITFFAKIIAVADVYHALSSDRAYKKKLSPYDTLDILFKNEMGGLDPQIVYGFVDYMLTYLSNNKVLLSNGQRGEVAHIDKNYISRPLIKLEDNKYIDLKVQQQLRILEILEL